MPRDDKPRWWVERTTGGYGALKTDPPIRKNIIYRPEHTNTIKTRRNT